LISAHFDIVHTVERHQRDWCGQYHNFRSWERCYRFFGQRPSNLELACLHLAAYLASFGMYRGAGFLGSRDYMTHEKAIEAVDGYFDRLRNVNLSNSSDNLDSIFSLAGLLERSYTNEDSDRTATQVLVTKIMMGTLGCVPASDSYMCLGLKRRGLPQSFSMQSYPKILKFCKDQSRDFERAQRGFNRRDGQLVHYPIVRVIDIYFWQLGFDKAGKEN
jgi:hypothetical protein